MSENSTPEERTEMPTSRRMQQLRREGQIFKSNDVVQAVSLLTGFLALKVLWGWMFDDMKELITKTLARIASPEELDVQNVWEMV
ncbi:MAG: EscU/YscU/HrcU family type III secretion system export apparatus switch protein, partial [Bdellovibrionales bacterium]|nr:EscU/YscU/HrcU family type III secretion system export apparatus switch protein [Bdellovibrionales bacterium]